MAVGVLTPAYLLLPLQRVMNCLLTFVYPKEDSRNGAIYDDRRCRLAVKVTHIFYMKGFPWIRKTNARSEKNGNIA